MVEQLTPKIGNLTVVIFGASGDLTHRKLAPALFHLYRSGALPRMCRFIGTARSDYSDEDFREHLRENMGDLSDEQGVEWPQFAEKVHYVRGSSTDNESLQKLDKAIVEKCADAREDNRLYYLALAPSLYRETLLALGRNGMMQETNGFRRVVIEKPFGTDLQSARELNHVVHSVAKESQVFRIDHYLGKDTVQNILVFRFANTVFEPVWNRHYVHHVQVSVLESLDIEGRASYYENAGVLRDMFQSHLLQLATLIAMEPPATAHAESFRDEKAKVLQSVKRYSVEEAAKNSVRGQYRGYRSEEGVPEISTTATFGAVKLEVNNWRWQGVPFYLRSGKALAEKTSDIAVEFLPPPQMLFQSSNGDLKPNLLQISIQPNEGVDLVIENKKPGTRMGLAPQELEYHFPKGVFRDAYERLLLDAVEGDQSLFTRSDEVELAWEIIDPFVEAWHRSPDSQLLEYERGSSGPAEAEKFLGDGHEWHSYRAL